MNATTKAVTQELERRRLALDEEHLTRKVTTTKYPGQVFVIADIMEQGAGAGAVIIWAWLRPYDMATNERAPMRCVPLGTVAAL